MDLLFELLGLFFVILGIIGSFLPVLPGPITGWIGLFLLHQSSRIDNNTNFLTITTVGLLVGLMFLGPFGIIIGPFAGAYLGERLNKTPDKQALKAAFGSLIGFLSGVFLKFSVASIFCYHFIKIYWTLWS